jgi:hypothetical protein
MNNGYTLLQAGGRDWPPRCRQFYRSSPLSRSLSDQGNTRERSNSCSAHSLSVACRFDPAIDSTKPEARS